jgi:hypothetical protein
MKKRGINFIIKFAFIIAFIFLFSKNVYAGLYGYGDSSDLNYKIIDNKIYYHYGDSTVYTTSLKPADVNWNEWKKINYKDDKISRREVVSEKNAEVIFNDKKDYVENTQIKLDNVVNILIDKLLLPV